MRWRAKPWRRGFLGSFLVRRLPAGVRLITRHPRRPAPVGTGFQNPNPPLQIGNDCPLAGNYLQQSFATRRVQV